MIPKDTSSEVTRLVTKVDAAWDRFITAKTAFENDPIAKNKAFLHEAWLSWLDQFLTPEQRDFTRSWQEWRGNQSQDWRQ